ncbi:MAG: outer membrane protein transport protein [Halioglobus sp.]
MNRLSIISILALQVLASASLSARPHAGFSGLAASADNAGTAGTNPAGITRFDSRTSRIELMTIHSQSTWEGQLGNEGPETRSSESSTTVVPQGYMIHPINDDFTFGFTILGMGFSEDLGDWPGRYVISSYDAVNISAFPSLAYKLNDKLSIAGSIAITYSTFDQERYIANVFDPGFADGKASLETDGVDFGFALSSLYEINDRTRWGLMYQSGSEPTLEGKTKFKGLGPNTEAALDKAGFIGAEIEVISKTPQSVLAGVYHEFHNDHALTFDAAWIEFSDFQLSEFYFDGEGIADNEAKYDNIIALTLGYSWPISTRWMMGVSGLYIDDMVKDEDRTATLPLDSVWSIAFATEWQWTDDRQVYASLSYMEPGSAPVATPSLPGIGGATGKYTSRDIFMLSLGIKFGGL